MLEAAYIGLTLITNIFLIAVGYKAIDASSTPPASLKLKLVIGLILWQIFIYALASSGALMSYDFPPRLVLAFVLPSFLFTGIFLFANRNKVWISAIPEQWIVYFQSFRILVEILFVYSLAQGVFNSEVTIEGYNYDLLFACTAPIIGYLVYTKKLLSRKAALLWNYLGLAVLASVIALFIISIYRPEVFGGETPLLPLISMSYPYVLIAGFLMPTAVFLHVLSILQLRKSADSD